LQVSCIHFAKTGVLADIGMRLDGITDLAVQHYLGEPAIGGGHRSGRRWLTGRLEARLA
jgi:hypothetical protein